MMSSFHARVLLFSYLMLIFSSGAVAAKLWCKDVVRDSALAALLANSPGVFTEVAETSNVGILLTDPNQKIIYANSTFVQMFGYDFSAIFGKNCKFLQGAETDKNTCNRIRLALLNKEPIEVEILNYHKDGRPIWIRLQIDPIFDESGELVYFFGLQTDITPEMAAARVRDQFRGFVAGDVTRAVYILDQLVKSLPSHDLSLPLKEGLGDVSLAIDILMDLVNGFLNRDFHESGTFQLNRQSIPLKKTIEDIVEPMRSKATEKGLRFDIQFGALLPTMVTTDLIRLQQIILNLITNAIRHTPAGTIAIKVNMEGYDSAPKIRFDIVDTGTGIRPEIAARIFQPSGFSANAGEGTRGRTDLGLTIIRKLAQALGGDLSLTYSALGGGSTFSFTIDPTPIGFGPAQF